MCAHKHKYHRYMSIVLSLIIIVMSIDLVPITESAMELARRAVIYGVSFLLAFFIHVMDVNGQLCEYTLNKE